MEGRHGIVAAGLLPYLRMSWLTTLRHTLPQPVGQNLTVPEPSLLSAMTPFQPLSGVARAPLLTFQDRRRTIRKPHEGEQQQYGSQQTHDKDPPLQRV